ncbi:KAP family P-loop NTPase fold protein [Shewanella sp. Shew256]|uniref:KAP family P-loop NTPase fold protein n=1 Tax=Shewanella sp. Shew256 TaxID=1969376 RepID=UPI000B49E81D|nr:P-loop NTPase fold protein [Shewanella sp. Shew256]
MENTTHQAIFTEQAKYADWKEKYTFENCLLKRGEYGEFLADYITGEHDGFVLNLDGGWGSGKTEFLKRFYSLLLKRNHPVIYIDAWESDFSKDPLTVVTSELLTQLEAFNYNLDSIEEVEQFKKMCGRFIKGVAVGVSAYLSKQYLGDPSIIGNAVQQAISGEPDSLLTALSTEHQELVRAIQQIRITLGEVAGKLTGSGANLPVVVLVDELDRCRPNYAIEMLEVIKHFFKTENFVFVVATDTDQLVHSIAAVYGAGFDAAQYLKRFFDRKASLASPNLFQYLDAKVQDNEFYQNINAFPASYFSDLKCLKVQTISKLANYYQLKIRDIDQLLNKLNSCLRFAQTIGSKTQQVQVICVPALIIGLIEFDRGESSFYNRRCDRPDDTSLIRDTVDEFIEGLTITAFIDLCISSTQITVYEELDHFERPVEKNYISSYPRLFDMRSGMLEVNRWANYMSSEVAKFGDRNKKYWLWEDYKKAIELAGNLE